jgi:hypothetical protein
MMDFDNTYCGPSLINMCIQLQWRENSNLGTAKSEYGKKNPWIKLTLPTCQVPVENNVKKI